MRLHYIQGDHLLSRLQVIHQLKQLGTVWQDVLPVSIYCKAMGNLLNTAITEVISKIMMLEVCLSFLIMTPTRNDTAVTNGHYVIKQVLD